MNEVLLGFNLRKTSDDRSRWDSNDRALYLLREDIAFPLSVDEAVWPKCEDAQVLSSLFLDYSPEPSASSNILDVYCDIKPEVMHQLSIHNDGFLIGITVVNDEIDRANELLTKRFIYTTFPIDQLLATNWKCLGYDVANYSLLSCLLNCGYESSEKELLVQKFASSLNEYGLFTSAEDAQSFRTDCASRVPEHAPFAVYGIWANGKPV